ncbi:MAG: hypothetical protein [Bacteriophage sp.]|nr:MAG: hypothetical protein [Bacteriophage sp.]
MAFASSTLAQRQAVRDAAIELDKAVTLAHDTGPLLALGPAVDTAGETLVAALTATGSATPDNQVIVSDGQALTGVPPTGTFTDTVTFTVANGVITGIALS